MTNEPPQPGASEPESPQQPPPQQSPQQPSQQPPPGYPPPPPPGPPPPHAQPGPYGSPAQGQGPYGQPPQPNPYAQQQPPSQPVWQGHQAPQQQYPPQPGWPGQPPYAAAPTQPKGRKGLLIGLLIVLALALVATAVVAALVLADDSDSGIAVEDISSGDCLVGSGLADAEEEISDIEEVDCEDDHDAEVFATFELGSDQDLDAAGSRCVQEAADAGRPLEELAADDLEIRPLVAGSNPAEGDKVVCFIRHPDGSKLSGSEF